MQTRIFHLQALSALHVGTGQGIGIVDLPIARARATNLPLIPGSSLKGVLRDQWEDTLKEKVNTVFGPYHQQESAFAGAVAFGDAHLLILPIRSFAGTVAYATCPFILKQYQRDLNLDQLTIPLSEREAIVTTDTVLKLGTHVALEDLDLLINIQNNANTWAEYIAKALYPNSMDWQNAFKARFIILSDDTFSFLADTATEIRTRIRIERETRIVKDGALWTEENLPTDSVLWGVMGINKARDKTNLDAKSLSDALPTGETAIQLGGKHTVGRGLCRFLLAPAQGV